MNDERKRFDMAIEAILGRFQSGQIDAAECRALLDEACGDRVKASLESGSKEAA